MESQDVEHRRIRGDGIELHVAVAGKGMPVILLHGFPECWRSWRHQITPLVDAGFSVWMPDLRGYPLSEAPSGSSAYHLRHLTTDVACIVSATGFPRAHVVGHDWGGVIAWTFSGTHPALLDKLVILNAPHMKIYTDKVWRSSQMMRSLYVLFFQLPWLPEKIMSCRDFAVVRRIFHHMPAKKGAFTEQQIQDYVDILSRPGALTAALNYYRANLRASGLELARNARTNAETMVIWGELDPALGLNLLEGLDEVAPRISVYRIPDAGHWIQNESPEQVNRLLVDFLLKS